MNTRRLVVVGMVGVLLLAGCAEDPNERANALYVAADRQAQFMREQAGGYGEALEAYRRVRKDIEQILSKYDTSDLAVRLISGEARVAGMTLGAFRALETPLGKLAEAGRDPMKAALVVGATLEEKHQREGIVEMAVRNYAQSGQFEQAEAVFETIDNPEARQSAYLELAKGYRSAGFEAKASELLERSQALLLRQDQEEMDVGDLVRLAKAFLEIGREETAMRLYEQAIGHPALAEASSTNVNALSRLSEIQLLGGDPERALEPLSQAHDMATRIRYQFSKEGALLRVAVAYAALGQSARVREIRDSMEDDLYKALALRDSAERLEAHGYPEQAREMRIEALADARRLEDPSWRAAFLAILAEQHASLGEREQAQDLLREAGIAAHELEEGGKRATSLAVVAGRWASVGQPEQAMALVTEALENLRGAEHQFRSATTLLAIGATQALTGMALSERDLEALSAILQDARPMAAVLAGAPSPRR